MDTMVFFSLLQVLLVLFEHASGYSIFRCEEVEDIGALLPEVQEAVLDFARFGSMLTLDAFGPFKSGINALENINCISEGKLIHTLVTVFEILGKGHTNSKLNIG